MTPEDEARVIRLEEQVSELQRELAIWRTRGLAQLRFKDLDALYAPLGHTH